MNISGREHGGWIPVQEMIFPGQWRTGCSFLEVRFNAQHRAGTGASGLHLQDVGKFLRMKRGC
jgi:hypothetical protein